MTKKRTERVEPRGEVAPDYQDNPAGQEDMDTGNRVEGVEELKVENEALKAKIADLEKRNKLNTSLLLSISKEIRTPLNTLTGFCSFLSDPELSYEKRASFTKIILDSSDHLLSTVSDIVNIAIIERGQKTVNEDSFNLNMLMKQLYEQYSARAKEQNNIFKYKTGLSDSKARIKTDKAKLHRVLSSLLINAIKFTGQGKVRFGYSLKDKELLFSVRDTGIGIPVELQKLVFKRFEMGEVSDNHYYCESSLGLSICKAYIEMLGGRIWVESTPSLGSSFYFTIPYRPMSS